MPAGGAVDWVGVNVVEKVHVCVEKHPHFLTLAKHIELEFLVHRVVGRVCLLRI